MSFLVGLDLGQAADYTALAVIEELEPDEREIQLAAERALVGTAGHPPSLWDTANSVPRRYNVVHLERVRLGTPYTKVAERVKDVLERVEGGQLVVDSTGVGRPVVDMLREVGLHPVAITITGGERVHAGWSSFRVPKRDLVGSLQVLLQTGRLQIAADLREARTLVEELLRFRVKITATAHDTYGAWRDGEHDDLVLAVAVACWWSERQPRSGLKGWAVLRR